MQIEENPNVSAQELKRQTPDDALNSYGEDMENTMADRMLEYARLSDPTTTKKYFKRMLAVNRDIHSVVMDTGNNKDVNSIQKELDARILDIGLPPEKFSVVKLRELIEVSEKGPATPESKITNAKNFQDLFDILVEIGPIQGSVDTYSPEKNKKLIEQVRSGTSPLGVITNTYGLREAVKNLLYKESGIVDAEKLISETENFEQLYGTLDEIGLIQGSGGVYTAEETKKLIDEVRKGDRPLDYITNKYGLRDRVEYLIMKVKPFGQGEKSNTETELKDENSKNPEEALNQYGENVEEILAERMMEILQIGQGEEIRKAFKNMLVISLTVENLVFDHDRTLDDDALQQQIDECSVAVGIAPGKISVSEIRELTAEADKMENRNSL